MNYIKPNLFMNKNILRYITTYALNRSLLVPKLGSLFYKYGSPQYTTGNVFQPKLSPQEVSELLRNNEHSLQLNIEHKFMYDELVRVPTSHAIYSIDSNQLASNTPIEDKLAAAKCLLTTGFLFGVFDGHGGPECSLVVSKRLFDYIAASLLPRSELRRVVDEMRNGYNVKLTEVYNDSSEFLPELEKIYEISLLKWCQKILDAGTIKFSMEDALKNSFLQLDKDICDEVVQNRNSDVFPVLLRVALSGSVACVAHIDGPHLHVANTGDCGAVLGEIHDDKHRGWTPKRLTNEHNSENASEVQRVLSNHPAEEHEDIIRDQRLLGMLMPFRAFGDVRFKWNKDLQSEIIQSTKSIDKSYLRYCITPPYLTAEPEVTYNRLRTQEKFLLIASDGLWESINDFDIINLVGEYMSGRQTLQPVSFQRGSVTLGDVCQVLSKRQEGLRLKPSDTNASTHLIRYCLGGTDEGLDHQRLSHSLTLPPEVRRYFRDDISIHVIYFNSEFLRLCPIELH